MNTQDASAGWEGGSEITFGRYFCCNQWSLEATLLDAGRNERQLQRHRAPGDVIARP